MLAHKAFIQAVVAAENVAGLNSVYERSSIPQVVFSDPDIVQVGMTVDEAKKRGFNAVSTRIFGGGVARSVVEECENCFIKIVYDKDSERVLGIIIMAPEASELAGEASLIIENGLSIKDLSKAVHPHPTISEFFKEIVDYIERRSTHYLIKR
jgi:dihydrolipoamide dehydrogenase